MRGLRGVGLQTAVLRDGEPPFLSGAAAGLRVTGGYGDAYGEAHGDPVT
jgi:hypothetical protein